MDRERKLNAPSQEKSTNQALGEPLPSKPCTPNKQHSRPTSTTSQTLSARSTHPAKNGPNKPSTPQTSQPSPTNPQGQRPPFVRRSPKSTRIKFTDTSAVNMPRGIQQACVTTSTVTSAENMPSTEQQARVTNYPCDTFMDVVLSVPSEEMPGSTSPDTENTFVVPFPLHLPRNRPRN